MNSGLKSHLELGFFSEFLIDAISQHIILTFVNIAGDSNGIQRLLLDEEIIGGYLWSQRLF